MHPPVPTRLIALALLLLLATACASADVQLTPPRLVSPANFRDPAESPFQYPEELWDAGVEGVTTLRIFITPEGTVDSARVETPSRYAAFDSAAVAGTRRLRFEPARRGDLPVGAWYRLPVRFELTAAAASAAEAQPQSTP